MKTSTVRSTVAFDSVGGHLVKVPVVINGSIETNFLLDTGAGVNVISERLCAQLGCTKSGTYTGQRMSGEEITLQFATVPSLSIGTYSKSQVRAGVLGLFEKLPKELGPIDGAVSLRFFEEQPFTIDYASSTVSIGEPPAGGTCVPLQLKRDHEKTIAFMEMEDYGLFEVDTGNSMAVLNLSLAARAGIDINAASVRKVEGKNETGFPFVSYYAAINQLRTAKADILQKQPMVCFKTLIHDGVIGNDFFKGRAMTFDLPGAQIIFH